MTTIDTPRNSRSVVVTVADVVEETPDARSLVFAIPEESRHEFAYMPGQFLTLRIPSDNTGHVARCYSLASSPYTDDLPKVTIKRTTGGYGSHWLCDNVGVGDRIQVLPPAGVFTPASLDEDLLLFAAGSGITPVMSILKSALSEGTGDVVLVYANRDEKSIIFADELRELAVRHGRRLTIVHWLEGVQGRLTPHQLAGLSRGARDHRAYLCGPKPFMNTIRQGLALAGVPRDRVHAEVFTSLSGDPFADIVIETSPEGEASTVDVELDGETHRLRWPHRATLVDVMVAQGLDVPYSCREGECGSCACALVEGEVDMDLGDAPILEPEDLADGYILGCQARPASEHLRIEF